MRVRVHMLNVSEADKAIGVLLMLACAGSISHQKQRQIKARIDLEGME